MDVGDRGQAHTLEAFSAAVVLMASVVFALQVTAVTPLTASTASQHIENQMAGTGGGVLDQAADNGTLKETVLYFDNSTGSFHNSTTGNVYTLGGPPTHLGEKLNETFLDRGIAFDLTVVYGNNGSMNRKTIANLGTPSDNAVTVHRTVTIYDDDPLIDADLSENGSVNVSSAENSPYNAGGSDPVGDQSPNSPVHNVFKVELTLWQM